MFKIYSHNLEKVAMVQLIYYGQRDVRRYAAGKAFVEFDSVSDYSNAVKELCPSIVKQEGQEKKEMEKNFVPPKRVLTLGGNELTAKTKEEHLEKQKLKKAGGKRSRNNDDVNCFSLGLGVNSNPAKSITCFVTLIKASKGELLNDDVDGG